jgi:hypothetical protein
MKNSDSTGWTLPATAITSTSKASTDWVIEPAYGEPVR